MAAYQTITVAGGNLFQIASQYLNNPAQWWQIASLNSLTDPMLTGINTLILPKPDATVTDGLPPQ